jgi:hypothetical protein
VDSASPLDLGILVELTITLYQGYLLGLLNNTTGWVDTLAYRLSRERIGRPLDFIL